MEWEFRFSATIAMPGGSGSIPSTTLTAGTWANVSVSVHDESGGRLESSRAYHTITTNTWGTGYDETLYGYDDMGRKVRVQEPGVSGGDGTIHATVYEERGLPIQQWMGSLPDRSERARTPSVVSLPRGPGFASLLLLRIVVHCLPPSRSHHHGRPQARQRSDCRKP